MNLSRSLNVFVPMLFILLTAANSFAQSVKIGGEDADVFYAVTGANKNTRLIAASPSAGNSPGQVAVPPEAVNEFKHYSSVRIYYRRNKCTQRKEAVIAAPGMSAADIQEEEKSKGQDCGAFMLLQDNVSWSKGSELNINYSGDVPIVTVNSTAPASASSSLSGRNFEIYLRGFGGASFINGNSPASAGFGGGALFGVGRGLSIGPWGDFQWTAMSMVRTAGSMSPGATFINTTAGFKNGNFGGALQFPVGHFHLGVRAGAAVAGSSITQKSGFCAVPNATNPTGGCVVSSTMTFHDTVVGPLVGGYISHSIFPHVGIFVEYDYTRLKDQTTSPTSGMKTTVFDVHSNNLIGGFVLMWGRHH